MIVFVGASLLAKMGLIKCEQLGRQMSDVRRIVEQVGRQVSDVGRIVEQVGRQVSDVRRIAHRHARAGKITEGNNSPLPLFAIPRSITQ